MLQFVVPTKDAEEVAKIVDQSLVPSVKGLIAGMPGATLFTFGSEREMVKAAKAVSYAYDFKITQALHKAINGTLSEEEAIWASWESYGLDEFDDSDLLDYEPEPAEEVVTADDVLDAYMKAKSIPDPARRKAALARVRAMSQQLK